MTDTKRIGLFFGSFNPIHIGHLIIANAMVENGGLQKVWFVVSPQNPLKPSRGLLHEFDRLDMVKVAIADNYKLEASDVEFHLPRPSYTINTLTHLRERHPSCEFKPIIGEDNLQNFGQWKNHREILDQYGLCVYPRPGVTNAEFRSHPNVKVVEAPLLDISATYIRECIKANRSIRYLVPEAVEGIINLKQFYR